MIIHLGLIKHFRQKSPQKVQMIAFFYLHHHTTKHSDTKQHKVSQLQSTKYNKCKTINLKTHHKTCLPTLPTTHPRAATLWNKYPALYEPHYAKMGLIPYAARVDND
ncbi:hypothetical protein DPMN_174201 [Dreissena polymorpha]|uniref:Uncharacterized protein n=1 Tax=Dreissena polymorpha TaxID=45954 RepID=A0A9D4E303_DREPO|nr:hypothetical protein DPMN_174201 [Dreissena polymorpha]